MNPQTLFNIAGVDLAPCEVRRFTGMLDTPDHTYIPEDTPGDLERQSLDILILEGLIERFRAHDGTWLDAWVITEEAINWVCEPDVQADIELARGLNELVRVC